MGEAVEDLAGVVLRAQRAARLGDALLAEILVPIEASKAVIHVPILQPRRRGTAALRSIRFAIARLITIPVVTELLWNMAVTTAPANTPSIGLALNVSSTLLKTGFCPRGFTTLVSMLKPKKRMPKPMINSAIYLWDFFLAKNIKIIPIPIIGKAKSVSLKAINWAVIVVPILAPKITPNACTSESNPAFTKPTTMTVVAEED